VEKRFKEQAILTSILVAKCSVFVVNHVQMLLNYHSKVKVGEILIAVAHHLAV
jgi:hypothetical protein